MRERIARSGTVEIKLLGNAIDLAWCGSRVVGTVHGSIGTPRSGGDCGCRETIVGRVDRVCDGSLNAVVGIWSMVSVFGEVCSTTSVDSDSVVVGHKGRKQQW